MKTLKFLLINLFVRDHNKTLYIIHKLDYSNSKNEDLKKNIDYLGEYLLPDDDCKTLSDTKIKESKLLPKKPKSKKDELLDGLNYLESKKNKTKQTKDSIYTLKMLLKNMS